VLWTRHQDLLLYHRSIRWLLKHNLPVPTYGIFSDTLDVDDTEAWTNRIVAEWDHRWLASSKAAWTHSLFPTLESRLQLSFHPNFFVTQGLSGYGVFGSYLGEYRRRDDPSCPCGSNLQTPAHVFQECQLYSDGRPLQWNTIDQSHLKYIHHTVVSLWEIENPTKRLPISSTYNDQHRGQTQNVS